MLITFRTLAVPLLAPLLHVTALPASRGTGEITNTTAPTTQASLKTYESYYGINLSVHESRSHSLTTNGYRPISLSAYGQLPEVNYAAVWEKRAGVPFEIIHSADATTFDAWQNKWRSNGYAATHVSATGPADSAVYAGVMEQIEVSNWESVCDLASPWDITNRTSYFKGGYTPEFTQYGTPEKRRYCVIKYEATEEKHEALWFSTFSSQDEFQRLHDGQTSMRFWRPAYLTMSEDLYIDARYVDSDIGQWGSKVDLTAEELRTEIEAQEAKGLHPISIQGGGLDTRYAVVFAENESVAEPEWTAIGTFSGFQDNEAFKEELEDVIRTFMKVNGVRQTQFAIANNGSTIVSRAYTLTEPGRPITQPNDRFPLASVSKMFTHASINKLVNEGVINSWDKVYSTLGYTDYADPRAGDITVRHLLDYMGGDDRTMSGDVAFQFYDIGLHLPNNSSAATLRDAIEYKLQKQLDHDPGTTYAYSNYDVMLLQYLLTNVTGTPYLEYIKDNILEGLDVQLYATDAGSHAHDNVVAETLYIGPDARYPHKDVRVSEAYGGDGSIKEETTGTFGLSASAGTLAEFIGTHGKFLSLPYFSFKCVT